MKGLVIALGILIALIGAYFFVTSMQTAPPQNGGITYTWELTELGEHPSNPGMPRTGVVLLAGEKRYPIGEYSGSCFEIDNTSWTLTDGEKSGVICWWAGGGSEVGIFEENGKLVVKEGQLEEGDAETPGFRGGYKTLIEL